MDPDRVDFEVKAAFLESTVDALNQVVIEQGRSIEQLERRLARLEAQVKGGMGAESEDRDPLDERPPHY